jgi:hypothetical protein
MLDITEPLFIAHGRKLGVADRSRDNPPTTRMLKLITHSYTRRHAT